MSTDATLEVAGLNVHRGESHVLHDVDLTVRTDRVTALLGRNGAGKTTTLMGVLGLLPRTGSVRLHGTELSTLPTYAVVRHGVGYVPENREVFAGLTVAENLRLAERGPDADYDLVFRLFPRLAERRRQRAGSMSGGEQQMLALARALLNPDNRLLLIDEPSQGLAPHLVTQVTDSLSEVAGTRTVLLVEQNLAMVRRLAADAVVLDQGRVVWTGECAALLDDPELTRVHLGVGVAA